MKISSNYDDFANLPQGAQFTITISYNRPIEGTSLDLIRTINALLIVLTK